MHDKVLKSISTTVSHKFPDIAGVKPQVRRQGAQNTNGSSATYLITYRGKSRTADGNSIIRIVRVIASEAGKIIKISTSR